MSEWKMPDSGRGGMSGMKPTPRTDIAEVLAENSYTGDSFYSVPANFARDLERQLSDALEREAKLRQELERVRADEREACARVCDDLSLKTDCGERATALDKAAAAIRARKEKE